MLTRQTRSREIHWFPFTPRLQRMLGAVVQLRHGSEPLGRRLAALLRTGVALALLAAAAGAHAQGAAGGDLQLQIALPAHAQGSLAYLVFNSSQGFPDKRDQALRHAFVPVAGTGTQTIDVGPLPPGEYAVTVYLDTNGNRKLDKGFFGIPKEPVGGSNNPKAHMGPPSYRDCAFQHSSATQTIPITLVH